MRSIPSFEANPKGYADLYQTVLIDTPVGKPHLDINTKQTITHPISYKPGYESDTHVLGLWHCMLSCHLSPLWYCCANYCVDTLLRPLLLPVPAGQRREHPGCLRGASYIP